MLIHRQFVRWRRNVHCLPPYFHPRLTYLLSQLFSPFFPEPCEDVPSYEFSCPRWQAQGYCEKRQKEMQVVCRKTCGFCGEWTVLLKTVLLFGLCFIRRLRNERSIIGLPAHNVYGTFPSWLTAIWSGRKYSCLQPVRPWCVLFKGTNGKGYYVLLSRSERGNIRENAARYQKLSFWFKSDTKTTVTSILLYWQFRSHDGSHTRSLF